MLKKSIIWRFFITIVLMLTFFLAIGFVGQTFFFEEFYTRSKVANMKHELESFAQSYQKGDWDETTLRNNIATFFQNTNSQMVILDSAGMLHIYGDEYQLVVEVEGEEITVPLTNIVYGGQAETIEELHLAEGMNIYLEGELNNGVLTPTLIQTGDGVLVVNQGSVASRVSITGTIVDVTLPDDLSLSITTQVMNFTRAILQWWSGADISELSESVMVEEYIDSTTGLSNKLFIRPIMHDGNIEAIIFTMVSLQPIGEAVEVVRNFYLYIIGILLLISALFAFSLSKYLAYSFQKINRVTKKMAELDFSETIVVTSQDEIGSLSCNINLLSKNLKETIEELQVANEKLQEDIEKERKLENTRKEFISGVSHELKTPLSIIKSYGEAIKDGITKENTDYYVDVMLQEAEKMDILVVDMLELAKLESGTYTVRKEAFSIIDLIDDVNYKLMFKLQDKDMDIDVETEDDYSVLGDRSRIEQVVTNFVTNAIRYGTESSTIIIRLQKDEQQLRISVENKGEPISQDKSEKIWDRFYRVDSARTRSAGGTGLGLSIVKNILQLHKVEFGVENIEDGVAFYFYLPLEVEGEVEENENPSIDKNL